ncbi:hypothetical protein [Adlercreutzia sp. ZJ304]|uniref:hypothetical protein n=1 Tax=Adlercreutzia sp. ZJ304 TaxID=2709791 RepID=UPI0013EB905A|nr:hypothetical protein [Adlercreutzia sp. ZJ304]
MELEDYLDHLNSGKTVEGGSEMHQFMHLVSQEAIRICADINAAYHTPDELVALFAELTGRPVPEGFALFPPFNRSIDTRGNTYAKTRDDACMGQSFSEKR